MNREALRKEIQSLPAQERWTLLTEIWSSLGWAPIPEDLSDAQAEDLRRRIEEYEQNPDDVLAGEQVLAEARQRAQGPC